MHGSNVVFKKVSNQLLDLRVTTITLCDRPKLYEKCRSPQNFNTKKLAEIKNRNIIQKNGSKLSLQKIP